MEDRASASGVPVPSEDVAARVLTVVGQLVDELRGPDPHRRITLRDSLERDLGISSLERVELLVRLEEACGARLADGTMAEAETPADLIRALEQGRPSGPDDRTRLAPTAEALTGTPTAARTVVEALAWHAERTPDRVHVHLRHDDGEEHPLTYGDLWTSAQEVAAGLAAHGVGARDTVGLMLRTEPAFLSSFMGTLLAGGVPVPLYPPVRADRIEEYAERQVGILGNAGARLLVTFAQVERLGTLLRGRVPSLGTVLTHDTLVEHGRAAPTLAAGSARAGDASAPALIQYTSGSTGQPKGVLLTHANLLANIRALEAGLEVRSDDVGVSWLPLYHDMGLIGAWLGLLYVGCPLALMSPLAFLERPSRWLWALHRHRGTLSPAPNFAYDLCAHRIRDEEIEGLDLSAARALLNGSEAVHPESLERFVRRFAPYGLRREALMPVYGLAECSVGLAAPPRRRGPRTDVIDRRVFQETGVARPVSADTGAATLTVVACGRPLPAHEIRVADDDGTPLPDRHRGRVQFRGPSATQGYYRNESATQALFTPDGWLETGDLGYLVDGEIYLSGRVKDLIIKGGRNLQPHEAEEAAAGVDGIRKGCVAAFGVLEPARGTERFVVVAETRETDGATRRRLEQAVIEAVTSQVGMPPDTVTLAAPGAVLKTSSGKIRRGATRDAYLAGRLDRRPSQTGQWVRLTAQAAMGHLRRAAGRTGALAFTAWILVLLLITGPVVWATLAVGPRGRWVDRFVGGWTGLLFRLAGCPIRVEGLEHLEGVGQAVFVANHASYLDPILVMATLPARLRFAVKARLATYPFLGTAIRKAGHIPIEKGDLSQKIEGAGAVLAALQGDESLFVFPEGTFVFAPGLLPFRLGAFRAAVEGGCPVVPVAIAGTRAMFPAGTMVLRRSAVTVTVGAPIHPTAGGWPEMVRLRDEARAFVERHSGESA